MKTKIIAITLLILTGLLSCDDDGDEVQDTVYEFISFAGEEIVDIGEASNSEEGYPLVVQLWAFDPYSTDISVNYEVSATNAENNVDFSVTPANSVTVRSGSLVSDTIWIKGINNDVANELERSFKVAITSVSQPDVKIGLGVTEPKKKEITFNIIDDECSGDPRCVFNAPLNNHASAPDDSWSADYPVTGVVNKVNNTITVTGNLIAYDPFPDAKLEITLTPDAEGSSTGTASFGEQETGSDADGYAYKFIETETGMYNGDKIMVTYDIYYWDGDWIYWYSAVNEFTVL
jgi:hypothetical protein